jgi:hypothetical protein
MGAAEMIAFEESVQEDNGAPYANSSTSALTHGSIPWRRSGTSRRPPSRR